MPIRYVSGNPAGVKRSCLRSRKAWRWCRRHNLAPVAGSDFHNLDGADKCGIGTELPITSSRDLARRMREGEYRYFYGLPLKDSSPLLREPRFVKTTVYGGYWELLRSWGRIP